MECSLIQYHVLLLHCESSGAVARPLNMYLKGLAKQSKSPDGCDSTAYGQGRASPSSFYAHHLASLSCAIVFADALALRNRAASDAFYLCQSGGVRGSPIVM